MNISHLEPDEQKMFKRGEKKIRTSRNIFGDKDVLFFLKIKEMGEQKLKARECEDCGGTGKVECEECSGRGEVDCPSCQ